jgi:hypothetical protein
MKAVSGILDCNVTSNPAHGWRWCLELPALVTLESSLGGAAVSTGHVADTNACMQLLISAKAFLAPGTKCDCVVGCSSGRTDLSTTWQNGTSPAWNITWLRCLLVSPLRCRYAFFSVRCSPGNVCQPFTFIYREGLTEVDQQREKIPFPWKEPVTGRAQSYCTTLRIRGLYQKIYWGISYQTDETGCSSSASGGPAQSRQGSFYHSTMYIFLGWAQPPVGNIRHCPTVPYWINSIQKEAHTTRVSHAAPEMPILRSDDVPPPPPYAHCFTLSKFMACIGRVLLLFFGHQAPYLSYYCSLTVPRLSWLQFSHLRYFIWFCLYLQPCIFSPSVYKFLYSLLSNRS